MSVRSKLAVVFAALAVASVVTLWTRVEPPVERAAETAPAPRQSGPSADVFAVRVEEVLPRLEAQIVAGAGRASDEAAEACVRDAAIRSRELEDIQHALFEGEPPAEWTDQEARALATLVQAGAEPLRRCVACGPRHGCGDAARALIRVENALRAYQLRRSGT
jgi:hypothetical protein